MGISQSVELPNFGPRDSHILITNEPNTEVKEWLLRQQKGIEGDDDFFEVIDPKDVEIQEKIGSGYFGEVYLASFKGVPAAAKKLSSGHAVDFHQFSKEVCIMRNVTFKYRIPYMCPAIGVVFLEKENQTLYLIMQLANLGSLDSFLRERVGNLPPDVLTKIALEISIGMSGLAQIPVVHRDLALRNILISQDENYKLIPQITDFGLSECSCKVNDKKLTLFPVKWTAPEVLSGKPYSIKADVWSYGITLWELFSKGAIPYSRLSNRDTFYFVSKGYRLEKPKNCPEDVYQVMLECWHSDPSKRPNFNQITDRLDSILQDLEIPKESQDQSQNQKKEIFEQTKKKIVSRLDKNDQTYYEIENYSTYSFTPSNVPQNEEEIIYNNLGYVSYEDSNIKYYQNLCFTEYETLDLSKETPVYDFTPSFECFDELPEDSMNFSSLSETPNTSQKYNFNNNNQNKSNIKNEGNDRYPTVKPVWVPDFSSRACMLCNEPFPVFGILHKHHCRSCGRLIDAKCSSNFFPIPSLGFPVPVRICNLCVKTYKDFQNK